MSTVNTTVMNTASRTNVENYWNEDNSIRVKVTVTPGKMTLKLDRHGQEVSYATRHGYSLAEVRQMATQLVEARSFPAARRMFRKAA